MTIITRKLSVTRSSPPTRPLPVEVPVTTGVEHIDHLVIGAGLSGIALARTLLTAEPTRSVVVLESRATNGGTWDLFRYPGIRSDSEMTTFGYRDVPWTDPRVIAPGDTILEYLRNVASDGGVSAITRYGHTVMAANWSGQDRCWTISYTTSGDTEPRHLTCSFLYMCTGYYRYDEGYRPEWPTLSQFAGDIIHPQHWPEDAVYDNRRYLVVGSGATAITLVPALADLGAQVTMLQRSPGYIAAVSRTDAAGARLRRFLPPRMAHLVNRWRGIFKGVLVYSVSKRWPARMRKLLLKGTAAHLPADFDLHTHFTPQYDPWDQRLCAAPGGDFFAPFRNGTAEIVTGDIAQFTPTGVRLTSGIELTADAVVTATGLNLLVFGGINLTVDGVPVQMAETVSYRGLMLDGVPNLIFTIGYVNASWTLKVDLVADFIERLLAFMRARNYDTVMPRGNERPADLQPLIDLSSGYVKRGAHLLPRQSARKSWRAHQSYLSDVRLNRRSISRHDLHFDRHAGPA